VRQEHEEARQHLAAVREDLEQARQDLQAIRRELEAARAEAAVGRAAGQAVYQEARETVQDLDHVRQAVHGQRELAEANVLAQAVAAVAEEKRRLGVTVDANAVVVDVVPESPAQKVGLQPGDVITAVNAQPVHSSADVLATVGQAPPGAELTLAVARGDEVKEIKARIPKGG
jgi:S1-C subfamily serine protease